MHGTHHAQHFFINKLSVKVEYAPTLEMPTDSAVKSTDSHRSFMFVNFLAASLLTAVGGHPHRSCSSRSVSVERRYRGFSRSSTVALSRPATMDSYRPSSSCYSACHRALFSAHSCSCCTQPNCSRSTRVPDLSDTRTPTTRRCTSVLQLHPRQRQLSASSAALNALTPR